MSLLAIGVYVLTVVMLVGFPAPVPLFVPSFVHAGAGEWGARGSYSSKPRQ